MHEFVNECISEFNNHLLPAITLNPRKQKVEFLYIYNQQLSDFHTSDL